MIRHSRAHTNAQRTKSTRSRHKTPLSQTSPCETRAYPDLNASDGFHFETYPENRTHIPPHIRSGPFHLSSNSPSGISENESDQLPTNIQPIQHLSTAPLDSADLSSLSMSFSNTPTDLELMNMGLNVHEPTWFLGNNFDINALNHSILNTLPEYGLPARDFVEQQTSQAPESQQIVDDKSYNNHDLVSDVQRKWYTTLPRDVVCYDIPESLQGRSRVDDDYREGLLRKLQPSPSNAALPSADFLVRSDPRSWEISLLTTIEPMHQIILCTIQLRVSCRACPIIPTIIGECNVITVYLFCGLSFRGILKSKEPGIDNFPNAP